MADSSTTTVESEVRRIIEQHPGEGNAISAGDIGDQVGIEEGDTHSRIRGMIRELLASGLPVGATNQGYFLITSQAELNSYVGDLYQRSRKIEKRIDDVIHAFEQREE